MVKRLFSVTIKLLAHNLLNYFIELMSHLKIKLMLLSI